MHCFKSQRSVFEKVGTSLFECVPKFRNMIWSYLSETPTHEEVHCFKYHMRVFGKVNTNSFKHDPKLRNPICSCHANEKDNVRRCYISIGSNQLKLDDYPLSEFKN